MQYDFMMTTVLNKYNRWYISSQMCWSRQ